MLHRRAAITGGMVAGRVTGASPPFNLTPIDLNRSFIAGTAQADHLTAGAESTQPAG